MTTTDANNISSPPPLPPRDYYTALYCVALTISSSLELENVLQSVVTSIKDAMQVKGCVLRLLDSETGQLNLSAVCGLSGDYLAKGPVDVGHSRIDSEALDGTPVFIEDVREDPRFQYQKAAQREGIVSMLCVPLEVRGQTIGVLRAYTDKQSTFNENDVQFLSVLASLAALAIENARLYDSVKRSYHGVVDAFWGTHVTL